MASKSRGKITSSNRRIISVRANTNTKTEKHNHLKNSDFCLNSTKKTPQYDYFLPLLALPTGERKYVFSKAFFPPKNNTHTYQQQWEIQVPEPSVQTAVFVSRSFCLLLLEGPEGLHFQEAVRKPGVPAMFRTPLVPPLPLPCKTPNESGSWVISLIQHSVMSQRALKALL